MREDLEAIHAGQSRKSFPQNLVSWILWFLIVLLGASEGAIAPTGSGSWPEMRRSFSGLRPLEVVWLIAEVASAIAVGFVVPYQTSSWASNQHTEWGFGGLIFLPILLGGWLLGAYLCLVLTVALRSVPLARLAFDAMAVVLFVQGAWMPIHQKRQIEENKHIAELATRTKVQQDRQSEWLGQLRESGAHGPLGQVPPMLEVVDNGLQVRVTNRHKEPIILSLRRLSNSAEPYPACPMFATTRLGDCWTCTIKPGSTETFVSMSDCAEDFRNALIEYRVGSEGYPPPAWWSDSAL